MEGIDVVTVRRVDATVDPIDPKRWWSRPLEVEIGSFDRVRGNGRQWLDTEHALAEIRSDRRIGASGDGSPPHQEMTDTEATTVRYPTMERGQ